MRMTATHELLAIHNHTELCAHAYAYRVLVPTLTACCEQGTDGDAEYGGVSPSLHAAAPVMASSGTARRGHAPHPFSR